jgi:predicted transcriptional regulator YdeE
MFETLIDDNFSVYLMRDTDADVSGSEIENLVSKFRDIPVNFATIDLGYMTLREFNETKLAKLLKDFEIPYFTIELPHYVKGHFTSQISEIKSKYEELKSTYSALKDKNSSGAQELSYLIDYYSNELRELNYYINQQVRTESAVKRIMSVIEGRDSRNLTFVHFGEESTLVEIMKELKARNVKSNILFIQRSKFLDHQN